MHPGVIWYLDVAYDVTAVVHEDEIIAAASRGNGFLHMSSLSKDDCRELTFEFLDKRSAEVAKSGIEGVFDLVGVELLNTQVIKGRVQAQ